MFGIGFVKRRRSALEQIFEIRPGDTVLLADGRVGEVQAIGLSPYYAEEIEGVLRAYIWGTFEIEPGIFSVFAEYALEAEILAVIDALPLPTTA